MQAAAKANPISRTALVTLRSNVRDIRNVYAMVLQLFVHLHNSVPVAVGMGAVTVVEMSKTLHTYTSPKCTATNVIQYVPYSMQMLLIGMAVRVRGGKHIIIYTKE